MSELIHPTYGTLDQLLTAIKRDVMDGYEVRFGLLGALAWFGTRYGEQKATDQEFDAREEK